MSAQPFPATTDSRAILSRAGGAPDGVGSVLSIKRVERVRFLRVLPPNSSRPRAVIVEA